MIIITAVRLLCLSACVEITIREPSVLRVGKNPEPKGSRLVSKPNSTGANKNAVCSPIECAGVSSFAKRLVCVDSSAVGVRLCASLIP